MSEQKIKHIHMDFKGEAPEELTHLLQELSLEASSLEIADICITDNTANDFSVPTLYLSQKDEKEEIIYKENYSYFDLSLLSTSMGKILLKRFLGAPSSLNLSSVSPEQQLKNYSFKMADCNSLGHYSDVLASESHNKEFNSFKIRNYFLKLVELFELLKANSVLYYPVEVDFMVSDETFIMQVCVNANEEALTVLKSPRVFNNEIKEILNLTNLLDIYFLKSGSKLVLCSMWLKKEIFPSLLIESFDNFKNKSTSENQENYEAQVKALPSEIEERKSSFGQDSVEKLTAISKIGLERMAEFVKSKKGDEEIDIIRVRGLLEDYPSSNKVKSLSDNEVDQIIKLINDNDFISEQVKEKISLKSVFDDLVHRVRGMNAEETDEIVRVRGNLERPDISQRIKAWLSTDDNEKQVLEGVTEKIQDDIWYVKKDKLAKDLEERKDSFAGKTIKESEEELSEIVSLNFEIPKSESNALVRDLLSLTCDDYKSKVQDKELPSFVDGGQSNQLKLENEKLKQEIDTRNKQIRRMRDLVDSMRRKIEANSAAKSSMQLSEFSGDKGQEIIINSLKDDLKRRDSHIESLKNNLIQLNENNDEKIKALEDQVFDLTNKLAKSLTTDNQNQMENTDLSLKLKLTEERHEVLNKKYVTLKEQNKQYGAEILELKNEVRDKSQEIDKLTQKTIELEKSSPVSDQQVIEEFNGKLKEAEIEHKALELKYKQIEQKNKFLNGKLQDLEKKLQKAQGGASTNGGTPNNATAVKQLEGKHERMKQMYDKANNDLAERKKELHKVKTESNAMKLRINDLERKLSKYEKNAA